MYGFIFSASAGSQVSSAIWRAFEEIDTRMESLVPMESAAPKDGGP